MALAGQLGLVEGLLAGHEAWLPFVFMAVAVVLLAGGGNWAVGGAARLATAMGVSKVIVGATVVSLGTTAAELCVSVMAAFRGEGGLALGNAVGSVIADTALVFGLCCVLTRLPRDRFVLHRQGVVKLGCDWLLALSLFGLAWHVGSLNGVVMPRWLGFVFVVLLGGYMLMSIRWARRHPQMLAERVAVVAGPARVTQAGRRIRRRTLTDLGLMALGLTLVVIGSEVMIGSVLVSAHYYHVPQDVLAVTVVAFGTSLPELVTAIAALSKGHPELMVGNVIGADILNVLLVAGVSATAVPLAVPISFFRLHLPVMLVSSALLGLFIFSGGRRESFRRWQGVPLLALYLIFLILQFVTRGAI